MQNRFDRLRKKARKGFRGYPLASVAFYGPDDKRASKVAVGLVHFEGGEVAELERWFSESDDVRRDMRVALEIVDFLELHAARSVVMVDRIIGCPHEEGIDYPEGQDCPQCPYWAGRDRWLDKVPD